MRRSICITSTFLIIAMLLTSCTTKAPLDKTVNNEKKVLVENKDIYKSDSLDSVKEIYITVMPEKDQPPKYKHTFSELNKDTDANDDMEIEVRVLFQEGKDGVPAAGYYGYGLTSANGTMKLRGQTARLAPEKSYKIELDKESGPWNNFKVVNLNKHPFDTLKIRNKLALDIMSRVPGITSLRTQFVHLYIRDASEGDYNVKFKDYGLYTHVENVDVDYLKNHGLDSKGSLYKAENFEFYRYSDQIRLSDDPDYKKKDFEERLGIEGNEDHRKLIDMLNDINNEFINIDEVIEKHFDRENYLTWLAINILYGNMDITTRNFYLYSPSQSDTWYFIPWDYDGSWRGTSLYKGVWQEGVSNYWGTVLHRRFLKVKANRDALTEKIEELSRIILKQNTEEMIRAYKPIVEYFLSNEPDSKKGTVEITKVIEEINQIPKVMEENRKAYYKSLERPMPVFMGQPISFGDYNVFKWDKSYDFQGDYIKYSIDISTTPEFKSITYHKDNIMENQCIVKGLSPGKYYWKLGIYDSKGNYQEAFDFYKVKGEEKKFPGIREFYIY